LRGTVSAPAVCICNIVQQET